VSRARLEPPRAEAHPVKIDYGKNEASARAAFSMPTDDRGTPRFLLESPARHREISATSDRLTPQIGGASP